MDIEKLLGKFEVASKNLELVRSQIEEVRAGLTGLAIQTPSSVSHCKSETCTKYRHSDGKACGCGCDPCSKLSAHLRPPEVQTLPVVKRMEICAPDGSQITTIDLVQESADEWLGYPAMWEPLKRNHGPIAYPKGMWRAAANGTKHEAPIPKDILPEENISALATELVSRGVPVNLIDLCAWSVVQRDVARAWVKQGGDKPAFFPSEPSGVGVIGVDVEAPKKKRGRPRKSAGADKADLWMACKIRALEAEVKEATEEWV